MEDYPAIDAVHLNPERGLEKERCGSSGPCLRRAGGGISNRSVALCSIKTTEELWQSLKVEVHCGGEEALKEGICRFLEPTAAEPIGDHSVIVRPDAAIVIGHRIVAGTGVR